MDISHIPYTQAFLLLEVLLCGEPGARRASIAVLSPWVPYIGLGVRLYVIPRLFYGLTRLVLVDDNGKVTGDHFWIIYGFIPKLAYEFAYWYLVL